MGIWVVISFGFLQIVHLWNSLYMSWYTHCFCIVVRYVYKSEAVGHGYTHFQRKLDAKVRFPSMSSLLSRIWLLRQPSEALQQFLCVFFFFFCTIFLVFLGRSICLLQIILIQGKKCVLVYFNNQLICIYLISYLVYLYENNHIDYKKKNLNPSDKTIVVTLWPTTFLTLAYFL